MDGQTEALERANEVLRERIVQLEALTTRIKDELVQKLSGGGGGGATRY